MDQRGNSQIVNAHVPLSEMFGYSTDLRSRTQGRATYTMQFALYMEVPPNIASDIIKRVRGDTFGYLQRSFLGCVSDVDAREAREVGERAVQFALLGDRNGSVAVRRVGDYAVDYVLQPLEAVAAKTRVMDDAFIAAAGNDVTPAFFNYLRPLLGSYMPVAARLRGNVA